MAVVFAAPKSFRTHNSVPCFFVFVSVAGHLQTRNQLVFSFHVEDDAHTTDDEGSSTPISCDH